MDSMDRDAIARALTAQVCRAGLSGADLRVWLAVTDRTLSWRWLSDVVSHRVLRNISGVQRPGRSLEALASAGLISYWPGMSQRGQTALSRVIVLVPERWERYRKAGIVWWPGEEPTAADDDLGAAPICGPDDSEGYGPDEPHPMDEVVHTSMDETVHTCGRDEPHPVDEAVHTGVDEPVHLNHEGPNHKGLTTRTNHEGYSHEGGPCTSPDAAEAARPAPPRPEWSLDHGPEPGEPGWAEWLDWSISALEAEDPLPEPARIFEPGEVSAEAAVQKFATECGLPLAPTTIRGLIEALRPMAAQARAAEMLMALGWWLERGRVRYPQDVSEHLTLALQHPHHCEIDVVNGMGPAAAIEEGRCRYRWAQMPEATPVQIIAKERARDRTTTEGIAWPMPTNVHGILAPEEGDPFNVQAFADLAYGVSLIQDPRSRAAAERMAMSLAPEEPTLRDLLEQDRRSTGVSAMQWSRLMRGPMPTAAEIERALVSEVAR